MTPLEVLSSWLRDRGRVVVAYSGGVDSAFLADVAHELLGADAIALTAVSASLAPRERIAAAALAAARGWRHEEIETDEASRPGYVANAPDRCFHCKDALFDALDPIAAAADAIVCVGTNLDDLGTHRPGLRAVAEHGAAQPLVEAGFTKAMIRDASRLRGLPVADKPATPCLASRIAYGIEVTADRLARIAAAEELVWALGVGDVRVRDLGAIASVEVPLDHVATVHASGVADAIRTLGFDEVTIDAAGLRSGRLLELLDPFPEGPSRVG